MGVEIINCPSCGKETFNRNFCIFCGKKIEITNSKKMNEISQDEKDISRFEISTLQERLKIIVELKNKFEKELGELNDNLIAFRIEVEKDLANLERDKDGAKKRLEELTVLYKLEELSENDHNEQTEMLAQKIKQDEKDIEDVQSALKELKKIKNKIRKLASTNKTKNQKSSRKRKVREKLNDLELAYKNKKIGNQLYTQLKSKYQNQLKK